MQHELIALSGIMAGGPVVILAMIWVLLRADSKLNPRPLRNSVRPRSLIH